jgi:diguanylate cyclase (GGDEF)-like protein/PAS domain S-box-containing protein
VTNSNPEIAIRRRPGLPEAVIACVVASLGMAVTIGWLFHVKAFFEIPQGSVPVVFTSGLCFLLCGIALVAIRMRADRLAIRVIAVGVMILCTLTLCEHIFDQDLGVDFRALHTWYDYGNTRPGRMAPNTAAGFILTALALFVSTDVRNRRHAAFLMVATFSIGAVGITGLIGYALAPDLLFGWARSARMSVPTAAGMLLNAIGIWFSWRRRTWYFAAEFIRTDQLVRMFACATLLVVAVAAGLSGFVLEQSVLRNVLEEKLESTLHSRAALLATKVKELESRAANAVKRSGIGPEKASRQGGTGTKDLRAFREAPALAASSGVRGAALIDARHEIIETIGDLTAQPEIAAPLSSSGTSRLIWDHGLVVRTEVPSGEKTIIVDQDAQILEGALFDSGSLGSSGEIAACISVPDGLLCFPGRNHTAPFRIETRTRSGPPLPMEFAVAGKTGKLQAVDYRGDPVIAAYCALGDGFGIVVKEKTTEIYAPIREALGLGVLVIGCLGVIGAACLYLLLDPLVTRMRASEQRASEREMELRTVVNSVGDAILTADAAGVVRSANVAACKLFGYSTAELLGQDFTALTPPRYREALSAGIAEHRRTGATKAVGAEALEIAGRRADSSEFPLELKLSKVEIARGEVFVGVMRDISERKQLEKKLVDLAQYDTLTGLPNRRLFDDRLAMALQRSRRSGKPMALLFLDLDGFKQVNDRFGHEAGDRVLIEFGARVGTCVRRTDTVGRLAGDEFVVILEGLQDTLDNPCYIAAKIVEAAAAPFHFSGKAVTIGVSVGVALYDGQGEQPEGAALLARADQQMYQAKHSGKNRYAVESQVQLMAVGEVAGA